MAKSKKQKILASLLAATTMASFYASPVFAEDYISVSGVVSVKVTASDTDVAEGAATYKKPAIKFRLKGAEGVHDVANIYYDGSIYKMDFNGTITADSLVSNGGITAAEGITAGNARFVVNKNGVLSIYGAQNATTYTRVTDAGFFVKASDDTDAILSSLTKTALKVDGVNVVTSSNGSINLKSNSYEAASPSTQYSDTNNQVRILTSDDYTGVFVRRNDKAVATLTDAGLRLYDANNANGVLLNAAKLATINSVIDDDGNVDGVDVSVLGQTVAANTTAITNNATAIDTLQTNTAGITRNTPNGLTATTIEDVVKVHSDRGLLVLDPSDPEGYKAIASIDKEGVGTFTEVKTKKVSTDTVQAKDISTGTMTASGLITSGSDTGNRGTLSNSSLQFYKKNESDEAPVSALNITNTGASRFGRNDETNVRIENGAIKVVAANENANTSSGKVLASLDADGLTLRQYDGDSVTANSTVSAAKLATINNVIDDNGAVVSQGDVTSTYTDEEGNETTYSLNTLAASFDTTNAAVEGITRSATGEDESAVYTTTIENTLKVSTDGTISNEDSSFAVDASGNVTAGKLNGVQFSVYDSTAVTSRAISEDQNGDIIAATDGAEAQRLNLSAMDRDINDIYDRTEGITERRVHNGYSTTQIEESVEINNKNGLSVLGADGKTAAATISRSGAATFNSVRVNTNITAGGYVTADGVGRFGAYNGPNVRMEDGVLTVNSRGETAVARLSNELMLSDESGEQTLTATKIADIQNITREVDDVTGVSTTTIEDTLKVSSDGTTGTATLGDFSVDTTGAMNGVSSINGAAVSGIDSDNNGKYGLEISGVTLEEGLVDGVDVSALKDGFDKTNANTAGITRTGEGAPGEATTTIETATSFTADGMTTKTISAGNGRFAVNGNGVVDVYGATTDAGDTYARTTDAGYFVKEYTESGDKIVSGLTKNNLTLNEKTVITSTNGGVTMNANSYYAKTGNNEVRILTGDEYTGVFVRRDDKAAATLTTDGLTLYDATRTHGVLLDAAQLERLNKAVTATNKGEIIVTGDYLKNTNESFLVDNNGNVRVAEITSTGDVISTVVDADGNPTTTYSLNEIGDNTQHIEHFAADANGTVDRTVIEGATTFTEKGMSVEGKYGSFNVQDVTNGTNGNTMIFVENKQGNDVLYIDTQTGNLVTKGAISAGDGAFLANETGISVGNRFLVDAAKGNVAIKNGNDVPVFQVNGETGQVNVGANGGPQTVITGNSVTTETLNVETIVLGNKIVDAATGEETTTGEQIQIGADGSIDIYNKNGNEQDATPVFHADYDDFGLKYGEYSMAMDANGFVLGRAGNSSLTLLDANKGFEFSGPVNLGAGSDVGFTYKAGPESGTYITLDSLVDKVNDIYDRTSGIYRDGDGNTVVTNEEGTWNDNTKKTEYTGNGSEITVGANGATFENTAATGTTNINGGTVTAATSNIGDFAYTGGTTGGATGTNATSEGVTTSSEKETGKFVNGNYSHEFTNNAGGTIGTITDGTNTHEYLELASKSQDIYKDETYTTTDVTSTTGSAVYTESNDGTESVKSWQGVGDGGNMGESTVVTNVVDDANGGTKTVVVAERNGVQGNITAVQNGDILHTVDGGNINNKVNDGAITDTVTNGNVVVTETKDADGAETVVTDGTTGSKSNSFAQTLDATTSTVTDGANTSTYTQSATSTSTTVTEVKDVDGTSTTYTSTVEQTATGQTITTGTGTTTITGDDVKIENTAGESILMSDIGYVGELDPEIQNADGSRTTLVEAVNNEAEIRRSEIARLDNRIDRLEDRIDKVGAMSAAIANLRTMGYDPAAPTEIAVGVGQYRSETGAALGLFHYPNRDFMLSLSVSTSGDEVMGGIGATWKFGRKSPEKAVELKKAQEAADRKQMEANKIAKAEQIKRDAMAQKVAAQRERHAKLAEEIGE